MPFSFPPKLSGVINYKVRLKNILLFRREIYSSIKLITTATLFFLLALLGQSIEAYLNAQKIIVGIYFVAFHIIYDSFWGQFEYFFDILSTFGRCFIIHHIVLISKFKSFYFWYFSLVFKVYFIGNQNQVYFWVTILLNVRKPILYIFESLFLCDIVNKKGTDSVFIVRPCNALVIFLTSWVPNLKSDKGIFKIEHFGSEINPKSRLNSLVEFSFYKSIK